MNGPHRADPSAVNDTDDAAWAVSLTGPLRAHAAGICADVAAVELIIGHRSWLSRPDFRRHIHHLPTSPAAAPPDSAWIDWPAALAALTGGGLPCAGSEAAVLRIAAALGADTAVHLRQILGGLDRLTITAITTAITRANGTAATDPTTHEGDTPK